MSRIARSLLFVPGERPERFEKAAASGAHEMVIDLEDAVSPDRKSAARDAAEEWLATGKRKALVRANGADTPWFQDDLRMLRAFPEVAVMLPKADLASTEELAGQLPGRSLIALVETVEGLFALRQVAALPVVSRIAFGSVDFSVASGIADIGEALTAVRTQIVLESCHAGLLPPIDGVSLEFGDIDVMREQALRSKSLGFGGKLCIHPRQVAAVNAAFTPSAEDIAWARRVIAAMESSKGGATTVDGKMVDKPVVQQAERILSELA